MLKLNAVIMAAGQSRRFGSNKLLLPLGKKTVIQHVLDHFPFQRFQQVVLVYSSPEVGAIAQAYPVELCRNDNPDLGQGQSIRLGLTACDDADGCLFLVADQPLLKNTSIITLTEVFQQNPTRIVMPVVNEARCNPVFFPKSCWQELQALQGDVGGKVVIRRHPQLVLLIPFNDAHEFIDIDTPEAYAQLKKLYSQHGQPDKKAC